MLPLSNSTPKLVLIVDDDDDIREVAAAALELVDGFRVETAASGLDAIRQAEDLRPDVILLDVMMPGMDGLETAVRLKAVDRTSNIPVILLTAHVDGETPAKTVAGVIAKPFDPMRLGTEISRLLSWDS
jgi:CheY-like chemotaxis protein